MSLFTYDIETFPNVFTCAIKNFDTGKIYTFEWSTRKDDVPHLKEFINYMASSNASMIGFNNVGFDYPILHALYASYPKYSVTSIYLHASQIIHAPKDELFSHIIWDNQRIVRQIDLFKMNHFDNISRMTSLKILEFNMRSGNIQDLPFTPGTPLRPEQIDTLIEYNINDVNETEKFYKECIPLVEFRDKASKTAGRDIINYNDTKIGKDHLIKQLEEDSPGCCYRKGPDGKRQIQQTKRDSINLGDVVFSYTKFEHPEFQRVLEWFKNETITETKGSIKDLSATIDGFTFDFGTGGIHGSIDSSVIEADDEYTIMDIDVASFYPNLSIKNGLYPEHLSKKFCDIYEDIYKQRKTYKKGTPENKMLKLALNGSYGDSNSPYSPLYDPKFTMGITINGQLSLCMLAEQMMKTPTLQMIQINTDGLTFKVHRSYMDHVRQVCKWWEGITKLELEEALYSRFFVRDVNNYIAEYESGKLKRKGAYEYKLLWHQNHSALVVPMAAEAFLVKNIHPLEFMINHDNAMDFMLRTKVPRSSRLMLDGVQIQNISRYYISNEGGSLIKIMPPLAKNPTKERPIGIQVGWKVVECNNIRGISKFNINYIWYLQEVEKLISYAK